MTWKRVRSEVLFWIGLVIALPGLWLMNLADYVDYEEEDK